MTAAEEQVFPSKWFLFSFLFTSGLAIFYSLYFVAGWVMWFFPAYIFLWSRGLQERDRGLRMRG